jgi:hypothetical protein
VWSLVSSVTGLLWVLLMYVFILLSHNNFEVATLASQMFFAGFLVLPIVFLATLVLGALAVARNGRLGKALGLSALLLALVVFLFGVVMLLTGKVFELFWSTV